MASIAKPKKGALLKEMAPIIEQLVDAVNALQNMTISPEGLGKIQTSDGNTVIAFNVEKCDA